MRRTSSRIALSQGPQQPGIQSFARATKPGVPALDTENKKPVTRLAASPSKKRKLNELENVDCLSPTRGKGETPADARCALTPSKSLRISELSVSSPRSGHYVSSTRPSRTGASPRTPTSPSKRASVRRPPPRRTVSAPVLRARPACVNEVLGLHSAFLKALTIHSAHQGDTSPAELKELLVSVERLWRKRKVEIKDIQRLLWVRDQCAPEVGPAHRLANYGLGRICLEKLALPGRVDRINEKESQEKFEETIDVLWEKALDAVEGDEDRVDFVGTLGLSSVHESLTPFTAFRKGQQRLQDLKGGVMIKMKSEKLKATSQTQLPAKTEEGVTSRRTSLLDRIREKALRQAKLPPPPSKETLARRAAAQRTEEVAGVLSMMRPAAPIGTGIKAMFAAQRTPYRMETVVANVKGSLQNPISEKEVQICVEILARADVAGQWVELVTVGQMKSVVLKSCGKASPKEIGAKVARLNIDSEQCPPIAEAAT